MLGGCWWPGATGSISSGGSCHDLVFVNATRGKPYFFNDDRTCATYCCCGGLENYVLTFDTIEGACAVRLPPLKLTSCLEYALRHWAWLTSPTNGMPYKQTAPGWLPGISLPPIHRGHWESRPGIITQERMTGVHCVHRIYINKIQARNPILTSFYECRITYKHAQYSR